MPQVPCGKLPCDFGSLLKSKFGCRPQLQVRLPLEHLGFPRKIPAEKTPRSTHFSRRPEVAPLQHRQSMVGRCLIRHNSNALHLRLGLSATHCTGCGKRPGRRRGEGKKNRNRSSLLDWLLIGVQTKASRSHQRGCLETGRAETAPIFTRLPCRIPSRLNTNTLLVPQTRYSLHHWDL